MGLSKMMSRSWSSTFPCPSAISVVENPLPRKSPLERIAGRATLGLRFWPLNERTSHSADLPIGDPGGYLTAKATLQYCFS